LITAGPQRARKRAPSSGDEDRIEEDTQPLVRRVKRELPQVDPYATRPLERARPLLPEAKAVQLEAASNPLNQRCPSAELQGDGDGYLAISESEGTIDSGAESSAQRDATEQDATEQDATEQDAIQRDTQEETNSSQRGQPRNLLLPERSLEDSDDLPEESDVTEDSDEDLFDLMVGAMRRGYEDEETDEEETDELDEDSEHENDETQEERFQSHCEGRDSEPRLGQPEVRDQTVPGSVDRSTGDSNQDSENPISRAKDSTFDYRNPFGDPLTAKEILSMSMHGIHRQFKTQRRCANKIRDVMGRMLGVENKPHDERTVNKRIQQRTGVKEIMYDCCPNSHMSYAMYPDDT
jgi:hypothetical protein